MTPFLRSPYPLSAIRPLSAIALFALTGCATAPDTRGTLEELTATVRALRADNARMEARLEKLEQRSALSQATKPAKASPVMVARPENALDALPSLTVVKLKPKKEAAPKLLTNVDVMEPPSGVVEELKTPEATEDPTDLAVADAQFERALDSLKTGNSLGGVAAMQKFLVDWPRHPRADNALYFAGIGLMSAEDYEGAASHFQRVGAEYPAGDAVIDSMLKLADCRLRLKQTREAKSTWERIVNTWPGTPAAQQAQARLISHAASAASP